MFGAYFVRPEDAESGVRVKGDISFVNEDLLVASVRVPVGQSLLVEFKRFVHVARRCFQAVHQPRQTEVSDFVHVRVHVNFERPEITKNSSQRPDFELRQEKSRQPRTRQPGRCLERNTARSANNSKSFCACQECRRLLISLRTRLQSLIRRR